MPKTSLLVQIGGEIDTSCSDDSIILTHKKNNEILTTKLTRLYLKLKQELWCRQQTRSATGIIPNVPTPRSDNQLCPIHTKAKSSKLFN